MGHFHGNYVVCLIAHKGCAHSDDRIPLDPLEKIFVQKRNPSKSIKSSRMNAYDDAAFLLPNRPSGHTHAPRVSHFIY